MKTFPAALRAQRMHLVDGRVCLQTKHTQLWLYNTKVAAERASNSQSLSGRLSAEKINRKTNAAQVSRSVLLIPTDTQTLAVSLAPGNRKGTTDNPQNPKDIYPLLGKGGQSVVKIGQLEADFVAQWGERFAKGTWVAVIIADASKFNNLEAILHSQILGGYAAEDLLGFCARTSNNEMVTAPTRDLNKIWIVQRLHESLDMAWIKDQSNDFWINPIILAKLFKSAIHELEYYIQHKHVLHRDIALPNMVLVKRGNSNKPLDNLGVHFIDWGMAIALDADCKATVCIGQNTHRSEIPYYFHEKLNNELNFNAPFSTPIEHTFWLDYQMLVASFLSIICDREDMIDMLGASIDRCPAKYRKQRIITGKTSYYYNWPVMAADLVNLQVVTEADKPLVNFMLNLLTFKFANPAQISAAATAMYAETLDVAQQHREVAEFMADMWPATSLKPRVLPATPAIVETTTIPREHSDLQPLVESLAPENTQGKYKKCVIL